jgi:hypothetical protein
MRINGVGNDAMMPMFSSDCDGCGGLVVKWKGVSFTYREPSKDYTNQILFFPLFSRLCFGGT